MSDVLPLSPGKLIEEASTSAEKLNVHLTSLMNSKLLVHLKEAHRKAFNNISSRYHAYLREWQQHVFDLDVLVANVINEDFSAKTVECLRARLAVLFGKLQSDGELVNFCNDCTAFVTEVRSDRDYPEWVKQSIALILTGALAAGGALACSLVLAMHFIPVINFTLAPAMVAAAAALAALASAGSVAMIVSGAMNLRRIRDDVMHLLNIVLYYKDHRADVDAQLQQLVAGRERTDATWRKEMADFKQHIVNAKTAILKICAIKLPRA